MTAPLPTTYKDGIQAVIIGLTLLLALLTVIDLYFTWHRSPSLGHRLERWSGRNPWLAGVLLVVFGALVAHFVLNPWPSAPP